TVNGSQVYYTNIIDGIDLRIRYIEDILKEDVIIKEEFKNFLKENPPLNYGLSFNSYFVFVTDIDLNNNLEIQPADSQEIGFGNDLSGIDTTEPIYFKNGSRVKHLFVLDWARDERFSEEKTDEEQEQDGITQKVRKKFIQEAGKNVALAGVTYDYMINSVGNVTFDPPTTSRFQEGVQPDESYTGCADTYLYENIGNANYGTDSYIYARSTDAGYNKKGLLSFDDVAELDGTVIDANITVKEFTTGATCGVFQVFKPWVETGATWNDWDTPYGKSWGTVGAENADDSGSENTGDGTGADRTATALDTLYASGNFTITSLAQKWVDGDATDTYGVIFHQTGSESRNCQYYSSEYTTTSYRPKLTIVLEVSPTTPTPTLISVDGRNSTTADLNCSATITDPDGDAMNVSVRWYKNDVLNLSFDYNNSYTNGTVFSALLDKGNLTVGDTWMCSLRLFDEEGASNWGNSSNLTILEITNNWICSTPQTFDNASCWSEGTVPVAGENVVFNASGTGDCNITNNTMPQDLNSFTVESGYTGSIHFEPLFAVGTWGSYAGTQEWNVTNNINISGGTMYIYGDAYNHSQYGMRNITDEGHGQIWRSINGNITVGSGAVLDGVGLGFPNNGTAGSGPGYEEGGVCGGAHGGLGGDNSKEPYGNASAPTSLGSAGHRLIGFDQGESGGSAIKLETDNLLIINGIINMSSPD
ncbi:hypothetical protein DRJ16_07320, partial [Candidatus Woesearchaeota archaeon]